MKVTNRKRIKKIKKQSNYQSFLDGVERGRQEMFLKFIKDTGLDKYILDCINMHENQYHLLDKEGI